MNQLDAATTGTATPSCNALSLRGLLAHLSATGRVATIAKPVALKHELATVAKRLDGALAAVCLAPEATTCRWSAVLCPGVNGSPRPWA